MTIPAPKAIKLHRVTQQLEVAFEKATFLLSAEYLRVFSPSAEVKGHGPGQEVLQTGKQDVAITGIEPAGNYAIRLIFSDKHDSGIYAWHYLYELGENHEENWANYLDQLHKAQKTRDAKTSVVKLVEPAITSSISEDKPN